MKIRSVHAQPRRRCFAIASARGTLELPWSELDIIPTAKNPVIEVAPDPELGNEGFTYQLASGETGTVHIDHVLRYVRDPELQRTELVYHLTNAALDAIAARGRSKRSLARQLGTSLSQLARLLDPTNTRKSIDQMIRLLTVLGKHVELQVAEASPASS
jgi:hypothetical protein